MFALALSVPTYAQLNCNPSISASVSGTVVTLTNSSTPVANPPTRYTYYTVKWGDNTANSTSNNNNSMNHTYAGAGTYTIKLYQSVIDSNGSQGSSCYDSTSTNVTITVPPANLISGTVHFDSNSAGPTDSMMIWLITFDPLTNILAAVDSQRKHVYNPFYSFTGKASGQYRTKAALLNGGTSGTGNVPTYHDSSLMWNTASVINHTGGSSINKHIYMRTGTLTSGPGFVGGNVSAGANKGTANGIAGMNILLLDNAGKVVKFAVTDANGDYSFSTLANGTYTIHPENLSFTTTTTSITVSNGQASFTDINFEQSLKNLTIKPKSAGINNVNNSELSFVVFPNPAKNIVTINWNTLTNETAAINITDLSGKVVLNTEVSMNNSSKVNVSNLQTGFYFMTVATENGTHTQKLIIQ